MNNLSARIQAVLHGVMAACLGIMATAVFVNVVLRYGFGSGIAASEELSRLLFVWMVFIGATAAYPRGELMAFTMLLSALKSHARLFALLTVLIRLLTILACVLLARGAWQQVVVGLDSHSVVLRYPTALLPLPAFLSASAIGVMASIELLKRRPIHLGHAADTVEAE
jgi:gluconokinase